MKEKYFADDRPIDYSRYLKMTQEELDAEIAKLEEEERQKRNHLKMGELKAV